MIFQLGKRATIAHIQQYYDNVVWALGDEHQSTQNVRVFRNSVGQRKSQGAIQSTSNGVEIMTKPRNAATTGVIKLMITYSDVFVNIFGTA